MDAQAGSEEGWGVTMRRYSVPVPAPLPVPRICGTMPVQEMRAVMLGKIKDGGYTVIQGRYICPSCGNAPGWGKCYSIHGGWDKNVDVWNKLIGGATDGD